MANFNYSEVLGGLTDVMKQISRDDGVTERVQARKNSQAYLDKATKVLSQLQQITEPLSKASDLFVAAFAEYSNLYKFYSDDYIKKYISTEKIYTDTKNRLREVFASYKVQQETLTKMFIDTYTSAYNELVPSLSYFNYKDSATITSVVSSLRQYKTAAINDKFYTFIQRNLSNSFFSSEFKPLFDRMTAVIKKYDTAINTLASIVPQKAQQEEVKREESGKDLYDAEEQTKADLAKSKAFGESLPLYLAIGGAAIGALLLIKGS